MLRSFSVFLLGLLCVMLSPVLVPILVCFIIGKAATIVLDV